MENSGVPTPPKTASDPRKSTKEDIVLAFAAKFVSISVAKTFSAPITRALALFQVSFVSLVENIFTSLINLGERSLTSALIRVLS